MLLLVLLQIVIGIGLAEAVGQALFGNPFYYWNYRFLYTSPDSLRDIDDTWTYQPDREIAEVAVYETPLGHLFQEYACRYQSDDMGFVDNPRSGQRQYDVLVLGDSFTFGQAGCSWADELRAALPELSVYVAGMQGTRPDTWEANLRYLLRRGYRFREIVLVFIGDDFFRPRFLWSKSSLACMHDVTACHGDEYFYPLAPGLDLLKASAERAKLRRSNDLGPRLGYFADRYLWVSAFLARRAWDLITGARPSPAIPAEIGAALDRMRASVPALQLVRVVEKDEEALHADDADSIRVGKYLAARNLDFSTCRIGYDGYFRYEGHPNPKGYKRFAECLAWVVLGTMQ